MCAVLIVIKDGVMKQKITTSAYALEGEFIKIEFDDIKSNTLDIKPKDETVKTKSLLIPIQNIFFIASYELSNNRIPGAMVVP